MALNFPNSPTLNQVYTDATSGFSYQWNGTVWISFSAASSSQIKTLDDISSGFNNVTTTFALTSGALSISPPTSQSLIINLGGVIQDATDDYSVSGSNITFSTAPTNGLSFSGVSLGPAVPVDYANNGNVYTRNIYTATASQTVFTITGTYTVGYIEVYQNGVRLTEGTDFTATNGTTFVLTTPANLNDEVVSVAYKVASLVTTTGQFDNLIISGISTFVGLATHTGTIFGSNLSLTGVATATEFDISGSSNTLTAGGLNVGIATAAEFDISGSSNTLTAGGLNVGVATATSVIVGSAVTINSSGINVTGITTIKNASGTVTIGIGTTALLVEGNARVTGILTIGSASITLDGTNNRINVGTGLTLSSSGVNVIGVITATSFVGSGSGLTGVGIGTNGDVNTTGNINAGIATFTRLDVPPIPITFSPAIGATSVAGASNIIITFDQQITKGTGNITLRENSAGGTAFSTIGVSSSSVTISGGAVTIDPPSIIGLLVNTFVVVDAGAFIGLTTTSKNALINTYSFTTAPLSVGDSYEGGFLICKASPLRWVVSPYSAEVTRCFQLREDANTRAQQVSGCTGWFVPTCAQLQNPGYLCRSFWGPSPCYSSSDYWSSCMSNAHAAFFIDFANGSPGSLSIFSPQKCVRAFRCVTY